MNHKYKNCLERHQIIKDSRAKKLVAKEIKAAQTDLARARESLEDLADPKWSTIKSYYSAFHALRALLYSQGYRERSHYCLIQAIITHFVDEGKLDLKLIKRFEKIKTLREKADYELEFSDAGAEQALQVAEELLKESKEIL